MSILQPSPFASTGFAGFSGERALWHARPLSELTAHPNGQVKTTSGSRSPPTMQGLSAQGTRHHGLVTADLVW